MNDVDGAAPAQEASYGEARWVEPTATESATPGPARRQCPRYAVDCDVTLGSDHNFYAGFVENMSAGGIFIASHQLKRVGESIEFNLRLPDIEDPVRGVGEVRWVREYSENSNVPPGMGIRFTQLAPGSLEAIEAFLQTREPLFWDE